MLARVSSFLFDKFILEKGCINTDKSTVYINTTSKKAEVEVNGGRIDGLTNHLQIVISVILKKHDRLTYPKYFELTIQIVSVEHSSSMSVHCLALSLAFSLSSCWSCGQASIIVMLQMLMTPRAGSRLFCCVVVPLKPEYR